MNKNEFFPNCKVINYMRKAKCWAGNDQRFVICRDAINRVSTKIGLDYHPENR